MVHTMYRIQINLFYEIAGNSGIQISLKLVDAPDHDHDNA